MQSQVQLPGQSPNVAPLKQKRGGPAPDFIDRLKGDSPDSNCIRKADNRQQITKRRDDNLFSGVDNRTCDDRC